MKLRWSARAESDLNELFAYIAEDNEPAAIRQVRLILSATRRVAAFPDSGRLTNFRRTRELAVPGTPYIIHYSVDKGVVYLVSITHGARHSSRR